MALPVELAPATPEFRNFQAPPRAVPGKTGGRAEKAPPPAEPRAVAKNLAKKAVLKAETAAAAAVKLQLPKGASQAAFPSSAAEAQGVPGPRTPSHPPPGLGMAPPPQKKLCRGGEPPAFPFQIPKRSLQIAACTGQNKEGALCGFVGECMKCPESDWQPYCPWCWEEYFEQAAQEWHRSRAGKWYKKDDVSVSSPCSPSLPVEAAASVVERTPRMGLSVSAAKASQVSAPARDDYGDDGNVSSDDETKFLLPERLCARTAGGQCRNAASARGRCYGYCCMACCKFEHDHGILMDIYERRVTPVRQSGMSDKYRSRLNNGICNHGFKCTNRPPVSH